MYKQQQQQQQQQHQQKLCGNEDDDDEQGWCKVTFKLDTSDYPQIIKYPRCPPTLSPSKEEIKKQFNKNIEQDIRDQKKRQNNIRLSINHPLFEGGQPDQINETNIYF